MTLTQLHALDEDDLAWQLLGAYEAVGGEYERWTELVGLTAYTEAAEQAFGLIHAGYADLWKAMGDMFHVKLAPFADAWRTTIRSRKGRLGLAISRVFARD